MSFSLVIEFQQNLHKNFEADRELNSIVKAIYQTIHPNPKYPYLYHHVKSANKLDNLEVNFFEIEGEINIYIRDTSLASYKKIISIIERIFNVPNTSIYYEYISGKLDSGELFTSHDLLTNRFCVSYFSLIKEVI